MMIPTSLAEMIEEAWERESVMQFADPIECERVGNLYIVRWDDGETNGYTEVWSYTRIGRIYRYERIATSEDDVDQM